MGRRWVVIGLGVALVLAVTACDSSSDSASTTTTRAAPRASLEMRPVVLMLPPPSESEGQAVGVGPGYDLLDGTAAANGIRYGVAPAELTERDVADARAHRVPGVGWVVDLTLTRDGMRALDAMAEELYPKSAPQNSVAIVVDGTVQSAPVFQEPRFRGGQVQISGSYTEDQAKAVAASLRP
jgi:preprotein translocase subunit SecD